MILTKGVRTGKEKEESESEEGEESSRSPDFSRRATKAMAERLSRQVSANQRASLKDDVTPPLPYSYVTRAKRSELKVEEKKKEKSRGYRVTMLLISK